MEQEMGIKVYNATPASAQEEGGSNPNPNPNPNKRRAMMAKGVQKTLSKTSLLGNFLPTGTLLTFEMVLPSIYKNGECSHVHVTMIHLLLLLCALSSFFFHFTDSFHGPDGSLYYGFVTPTGLSVFQPGLPDLAVPKDHRFRLAFTDFVHAVMSAMVFLAIAVSDHRVTNCLFRGRHQDMEQLPRTLITDGDANYVDLETVGFSKNMGLRLPEDPFYKQMAAEFSKYQISTNVYAFSDKYTDIASLGTLAKDTAGQVYYYPAFQSAIHGEKLRHELRRDLTRETAWEAVMCIRCAKGVHFTTYHGNFMLRSTDLLALPAVDCDKAFAMQLSLEETLLTTQTMYFQVALLYTASCGERRTRVHTMAVPVVTELADIYRLADIGVIVSLLSRLLAIVKSLSQKLEDARTAVQLRIVKALREYQNLYAVQHRLANRMIYPESLKFLMLYGLAVCRSIALRGGYGDVPLDERCAAGHIIMTVSIKRLLKLLYPSLIRLDEYLLKADDLKIVERRLPLTGESLDSRGLYIYDDGFWCIIWFDYTGEHDNEMSRRLMRVLEKLRNTDRAYYQLSHLVRQGEQPKEGFLLLANFVEDQMGGHSGYAEWMLQISRQVQQS